MPQHLRKTTAKLVNFGKSTKEKTKKQQGFFVILMIFRNFDLA